MKSVLDQTSKFLSYVLRHKPESIDLILDSEGWAEIENLIAKSKDHGTLLSRPLIEQVVKTSDKKRFSISENGLKIRAVQGHSSPQVQINHTELSPPEFLYHGTATRFVDQIKKQGLKPGSRHYVHLSSDVPTAVSVGRRHGQPFILTIKALLMVQQGFQFYLADNGVWLTKAVPPDFINFD